MISDTKASKAIPTAKTATIIEIIVHGGRLHSVGTRKERGKVARFDVKNCIYVLCPGLGLQGILDPRLS